MWSEKRANGKVRFCERYTDYLTGKEKKVSITLPKDTAANRKIAMEILSNRIEMSNSHNQEHEITFEELITLYREDQKKTVKKSTYTRNYYAVNTLMSMLGKETIVDRMSAGYIREEFLKTGKQPGTLNEHLTRLKAIIKWGYVNDYISSTACIDKMIRFKDKPHSEKIKNKYLERTELSTLIQNMDVARWKLLTEFLALSGLRFGEASALSNKDVDIKNRIIHVTKNYDSVNDVTTTPKTPCSIRDVYIQDELLMICKKVKIEMNKQRLIHGYNRTELFFCKSNGKSVDFYGYNKYLRETSNKCLGRSITPHTLRHTHASLLAEQNVPLESISRRLGHENSAVTREIYIHITSQVKERDNSFIEKIQIL